MVSLVERAIDAAALRQYLHEAKNPDGGWGYSRGKTSRLEPTCWALLALPSENADVLRRWPAHDGLLAERAGGDSNYAFHALALIVLMARNVQHVTGNSSLVGGLLRAKGVTSASTVNRQNNALVAWPWIADTFSWVEPTAWALLALKKGARAGGVRVDAKRIADARALLLDRCCVGGGWNYGNANMLGKDLKPYVSTTAIALLALQDDRSEPAVERSIEFLERAAVSERSGVALSLAFLAVKVFGRNAQPIRAALDAQISTTLQIGNHMAVALAAIVADSHSHDAVIL